MLRFAAKYTTVFALALVQSRHQTAVPLQDMSSQAPPQPLATAAPQSNPVPLPAAEAAIPSNPLQVHPPMPMPPSQPLTEAPQAPAAVFANPGQPTAPATAPPLFNAPPTVTMNYTVKAPFQENGYSPLSARGKSYFGAAGELLKERALQKSYRSPFWATAYQCRKFGCVVRGGEAPVHLNLNGRIILVYNAEQTSNPDAFLQGLHENLSPANLSTLARKPMFRFGGAAALMGTVLDPMTQGLSMGFPPQPQAQQLQALQQLPQEPQTQPPQAEQPMVQQPTQTTSAPSAPSMPTGTPMPAGVSATVTNVAPNAPATTQPPNGTIPAAAPPCDGGNDALDPTSAYLGMSGIPFVPENEEPN